jgi:hypothetical protein
MKNFNVLFENDERKIVVEFQPREENGNVNLDYTVTVDPPFEPTTEYSDDDKHLIYMANTFLESLTRNVAYEEPMLGENPPVEE